MSHYSCPECAEVAVLLLQMLTGSRDRRTAMRAECYLAIITRKPEIQADLARKYGVTRAAVSKVICEIKDDLGISGRYGKDGLSYKEKLAKLRGKL